MKNWKEETVNIPTTKVNIVAMMKYKPLRFLETG